VIKREVELVFSEAQLASVNTALGEVPARKAALKKLHSLRLILKVRPAFAGCFF
jgi:hypothetical protein